MVHVAIGGWVVTAGDRVPARHVTGSHEGGELGRRDVARLGLIRRRNQRLQMRAFGQFGDHLRGYQAFSTKHHARRPPAAIDAGLFGDHMNHNIAFAHPRRGRIAGGGSTATRQPICTGGQRAQGVCPSLLARARVGVAYRPRQLIQPEVKGAPGGGQHGSSDERHPRFVGDDVDETVPDCLLRPPYRVPINGRHHPVHFGGQPTACQRRVPGKPRRQNCVNSRQHLAIGDQICPEHDGLKGAIVDVSCLKKPAHLG